MKKCPACGFYYGYDDSRTTCFSCKIELQEFKATPQVLTAPDFDAKYENREGKLTQVVFREIKRLADFRNGKCCLELDDGTQYILPIELYNALNNYFRRINKF